MLDKTNKMDVKMDIKMEKMDPALEQQFDLNLIEAVKMNPVIYDRSHFNYKHFVRKAQTWKQIAESLGVPGKWDVLQNINYLSYFKSMPFSF